MLISALALCALQAPPPITVPLETPTSPPSGVIVVGEPLHAELGCARCHDSFPSATAAERVVRAPSLEQVGAQRSAEYLRRYLTDPLHVRPGTRMPDMLAGLEESTRGETVEDLVHYLTTRGGPFDSAPRGASLALLDEGRQLFHEVGCVACHGPEETYEALFEPLDLASISSWTDAHGVAGDAGPPELQLLDLSEKTSVNALAAFLLDPVATRRSGRMPSLALTPEEAEAIAMYLLRAQVGSADELIPVPGLRYSYYEHRVAGAVPDLTGLAPAREGVLHGEVLLPEHRSDNFVVVIEGQLVIEAAGTYAFHTTSDDGSQLFVDRELVVDNRGNHAMRKVSGEVELDAGEHELRITYFENSGDEGLEVSWSGPDFELRPLHGDDGVHRSYVLEPAVEPFEPDPARILRGKQAFEDFSCVICHDEVQVEARGYGEVDHEEARGCLSDLPQAGVPHFGLSEQQLEELLTTLTAEQAPLPREETPAEEVERVFRNARCHACHARGEFPGAHAAHRDYFFSNGDVDLGEEGRIPPHLDNVGAKLTGAALHRVLFEGEAVRPYLVTRMPQFGAEVLGTFTTAVQAADAPEAPRAAPEFSAELANAGQLLTGTKGFGCIQCHTFDGYPSLGIPAVDLAEVDGRIRYPWFRDLVLEPASINMNTRMPGFWIDGESPVKDVLGGDKDAQIDALWAYLSLGGSMPLPHGLVTPDSAYELTPDSEPVLTGVFMRGVSPRTIAVGLPENVHYAFDVENSRLALVWRGRFFNARGTWQGRAGALEGPASDDALALPEGPPFALLEAEDQSWPLVTQRAPKLRALGRRFDEARRPIFRYSLGEIVIEERLVPTLVEGRGALRREFTLASPAPVERLTFQAADGTRERVVFSPHPDGDGHVAELTTEISW